MWQPILEKGPTVSTTTAYVFDCIGERELEYREKPDALPVRAIVRLGKPCYVAPPPGEEEEINEYWIGPFEIVIEGKEVRSSHAYGGDGIQALQLALYHIGLELQHLYPGQFTMEGQPDGPPELGFPTSTK
jgi:hypothetical protein